MTLVELKQLLDATGLPVAYSHFPADDSNNPPPPPPFICYLEIDTENFFADGKVYKKVINVDIELYTKRKDISIESTIERLLNENEIPWDSNEQYIDEEKIFQKIYEVRLF